ncbi:hypothetical protein RBSH_04563 [Rhodopirellula baltica SH28]|uniref:Uncharacterized protein n=1 Tax=Rhodopirellula baltica SH28 TaxID=993517 RepID=K5D163_RHOBT|nr:hypothetical protein RBSH_04563 [Rhodopirellula baltica SH28]
MVPVFQILDHWEQGTSVRFRDGPAAVSDAKLLTWQLPSKHSSCAIVVDRNYP